MEINFKNKTTKELLDILEFAKEFINKASDPKNHLDAGLESAWEASNKISAELITRPKELKAELDSYEAELNLHLIVAPEEQERTAVLKAKIAFIVNFAQTFKIPYPED